MPVKPAFFFSFNTDYVILWKYEESRPAITISSCTTGSLRFD